MKKQVVLLTVLVFALIMGLVMPAAAQGPTIPLPAPHGDVATHIIVFKSGVGPDNAAADLQNTLGLTVTHVYRHTLNGMAAVVPDGRLRALKNDARVAYVEPNMQVSIAAQTVPTGIVRSFASGNANLDIDGTDDFRVDVDVAVLDTGIDLQHPDLNVVGGIDCTLKSGNGPFATYYCGTGNGGDDDQYHGTHVAGTIGALDNGIGVVGVAPGARLWAVKVLNSQGSGYTSGIIAGIDWVVARNDIEVINMSLGGSGISAAYKDAIDNAVANGVVVVVAAGNSDADSTQYSPAYVPSAITVSALADFDGVAGGLGSPTCRTDIDDTLADFSNWGAAVDIAAPGVCIYSTYPLEQGEYASISGTSMAAPHVAGAAALLASGNNAPQNAADVQAIRDALVNSGNFNWIDDSGDGIFEPLLDLSNTNLFNPTLVAGGGDGGGNGGGGGGGTTVSASVADLDGTASPVNRKRWNASVSTKIVDANGAPVANATVSGSWVASNGATATSSCVTDGSGVCAQSVGVDNGITSVTFSVSGVAAAGYTYNAAGNSDPDGDSNGTSISLNKP